MLLFSYNKGKSHETAPRMSHVKSQLLQNGNYSVLSDNEKCDNRVAFRLAMLLLLFLLKSKAILEREIK